MTDVLSAVAAGDVDAGLVAIENSIEGTVNLVLDALIFEHDLHIQREIVHQVSEHLLGPAGMTLPEVRRVVSFPVATAQCRQFLSRELPGVEEVAANSTAEAVELVAKERVAGTAAIGTALAAKLHHLSIIASGIEDHDSNKTRFVLVARPGPGSIPVPTGHDKTSIVCFQRADVPGSLHAILGQFSARNLNLTKLESRPTKRELGQYCFIIDFSGHLADEVVADCLRDLHAQLAALKFLGSYPAAGAHGHARRRDAAVAWRAADEWVLELHRHLAR